MPPLVDNQNPSLTYTFYSEMTPLSFPSTHTPSLPPFSNPPSPLSPDESITPHFLPMAHSRSHGKRRDPSYIPRPSNAFILFRSAFIRDRKVSDKVEGNHSSLSKIIGHSWKKLSPDEREKWEAQAVAAQAEHRAMYPDWRFRPGSNALAKLKIKDGGTTTPRRRSARVKDPPDETADDDVVDADQGGKGKEKGKGKNRSSGRVLSLEEMRCAKIADFVADGIRGEELEVAVKQWEGDRKMGKERSQKSRSSRTRGTSLASVHARSHSHTTPTVGSSSTANNRYPSNTSPDSSLNTPQVLVIDAVKQAALNNGGPLPSGVPLTHPLTHMFKRSLSAPASHTDLPTGSKSPSEPSDDSSPDDASLYTATEPRSRSWDNYSPLIMQVSPTGTHSHVNERRDSISFPMSSGANTPTSFDAPQHLTWQDAENQRRMEEMQEPNSWWGDSRSAEVEPSTFGYHGATEHNGGRPASVITTTDMGYENSGSTHFDSGYVEYASFDSPHDGSQNVEWTDISSNTDRHGLSTVIENSYKDGNTNSPHTLTPPTIYAPPLSSGYYYTQPPAPPPPSSFSTLTGWAGDYKVQPSNLKAWPDHPSTFAPPSSTSTSSNWYSPDSTFHWDGGRFEHGHCPSLDSQDWDRLEYRADTDLHLAVEPLRPMTFQDEIHRLQGGSS